MSELVSAGLQLMLVGMGTVFVFLTLLVFATQAMSAIIRSMFPVEDATDAATETAAEIAAISAAVHQYRQQVENRK